MLKNKTTGGCKNRVLVTTKKSLSKWSLGYLPFVLVLGITFLSGVILTSFHVSAADSVVDEISITVPVSCSLSGIGMNTHNAEIINGTYEDDIGTTTLKAFCNDNNGFAIYATGFTGDEVGATNSNKLVGTPASVGNIDTGTATSGNTSNWAMKLETDGTATYAITLDNGFGSYSSVPNAYTKVAHRNSSTDVGTNATGATLTTTYAAYMSSTQGAGTYAGKVIYTLVHPANHVAPVYLDSNADNISEVNYLQQFAVVSDANRQAIIDSMVPEQQYTVADSRDGKTYTIAKYATSPEEGGGGGGEVNPKSSGNKSGSTPIYDVWMTKNLDLDLQAGYTYTNEDTDIGYNTQTGTYNTATWSPTSSTMTSANNNWTNSSITPESYDPGNLYWNGTLSNGIDWNTYSNSCSNDATTNLQYDCNESLNPIATYTSSTGSAQYHLGNYYNWTAAVAMNDSSSHVTYNEIIEQSICPAGWTLPRVDMGEDSFYALWNQYGMIQGKTSNGNSYIDSNNNGQYDAGESALWTSPLYFAASGYFPGVVGVVGYYGAFWSPVVNSSSGAHVAFFSVSGSSYSDAAYVRGFGGPVRCIARPVVSAGAPKGPGGS